MTILDPVFHSLKVGHCQENVTQVKLWKIAAKVERIQENKEERSLRGVARLAETAPLAAALARLGEMVRTAPLVRNLLCSMMRQRVGIQAPGPVFGVWLGPISYHRRIPSSSLYCWEPYPSCLSESFRCQRFAGYLRRSNDTPHIFLFPCLPRRNTQCGARGWEPLRGQRPREVDVVGSYPTRSCNPSRANQGAFPITFFCWSNRVHACC